MALQHIFSELEAARTDGVIERYAFGGAVGPTFYIEPSATQVVDVFVVLKQLQRFGLTWKWSRFARLALERTAAVLIRAASGHIFFHAALLN